MDIVDITKYLSGIKENTALASYTTFKIGGVARFLYVARNADDIMRAVGLARKAKTPFFILGGGSNVLVADSGFRGLVIKMENDSYQIIDTCVNAEAAVKISELVEATGKRGLSGLEWAGGLPGTVGGAIRGNAGAFGGEMKDSVEIVNFLDQKGKVHTVPNKQCKFSYRSSVFKKKNWIILSAVLRMKEGEAEKVQSIARDHMLYRKERHPLEYPSAGSVFKNCPLSSFSKKTQKNFLHVVKNDPFPVVPVAYLISEAGLKGAQEGYAQVSFKHPNYIVNLGKASAKDVLKLIQLVKRTIKKKFGITLEEEIYFLK